MFCLFFLGKTGKMLPKSRFSKPIFGRSAGSPKLDRPYCKRFWIKKRGVANRDHRSSKVQIWLSEILMSLRWLLASLCRMPPDVGLAPSVRYFRNPYGTPRPTESENPPATKKEIPKTPKTPIIPKSRRSFPKSRRPFPKSRRPVPKSRRSFPKSKR